MRDGCPVIDTPRSTRVVPSSVWISSNICLVSDTSEPEPVSYTAEIEVCAVGIFDRTSSEPEWNEVDIERRGESFRFFDDALPNFVGFLESRNVVDEGSSLVAREGRNDDLAVNLVVLVTSCVRKEVIIKNPLRCVLLVVVKLEDRLFSTVRVD